MDPVTSRVNTLRGTTLAAENAEKDACPAGHPLAGDNLSISSGKRRCRACARAASAAYRARRAAV